MKKYSFSLKYKVTLYKRFEFDSDSILGKSGYEAIFLLQLVILLHCVRYESSTCWQRGGGKSHVQ